MARDFLRTETLRLAAALQMGDLVDTPLEARFNRLVRLARQALGVRAATIGLFDERREWIKAADGWTLRDPPLAESLAATLVTAGVPTIVGDTCTDERCRGHHLVTHPPKVRYCAVYPLRDRGENVVGALAAYDIEPRPPTGQMMGTLVDVGQLAQRELFLVEASSAQDRILSKLDSARRQALLDELTRLWNRRGALQLLEDAIANCASQTHGLGVCIADIDRFKEVNDTLGHQAGDVVLRKVAAVLVDSVRPMDAVCRLGGEEFLLIIPAVTAGELTAVMERVRQRVARDPIGVRSQTVRVTMSLGGYVQPPSQPTTTDDVLKRADDALYQAKSAGRNVVVTG